MKKFLAVLLVVTLAITGVFAVDMSIGAELGYGQHIMMPKEGDENSKEMMVPVRVDLLLGLDDLPLAFRVDAGTNVFKILDDNAGDMFKATPSISVSGSVYYKYAPNNKLSVLAGLGLGYDRVNFAKMTSADAAIPAEAKEAGASVKAPRNVLSMYIDAQVRYEVVDHVEIFGGLTFGGAVMDKATMKMSAPGLPTVEQKVDMNDMCKSNIRWGINVGAAYKF